MDKLNSNNTTRLHGRKIYKGTSPIDSGYNNYKNEDNQYKEAKYEEVTNNNHYYENKNKKLGLILVLVVLLSFVSGFLGALFVIYFDEDNSEPTTTSNINITETNSIASAVEKVYDAVVVVESYANDELYSTGTGFVYKKENNKAYIMTNNHVIDGGDSIRVLFNSGNEVETTVVGSDTYSDIAVLSIDDSDEIVVAQLGNTDDLRVGDTVFTVGSPEGSEYAGTVTKGVLSAKERLVAVALTNSTTSDYYMNVLQTDAAINPGNSGGPLCNTNGEVIGITNMKLVDSSVEGMGFAIPIEDAMTYAEILETEGRVTRPYIGISMLDVSNSYYLWQAGIMIPNGVTEGVVVYSVENNSPASRATLQSGDIITAIDGETIASLAEFRYELYKHSPGDTIEITYNRNGTEQTTEVTLTESNS